MYRISIIFGNENIGSGQFAFMSRLKSSAGIEIAKGAGVSDDISCFFHKREPLRQGCTMSDSQDRASRLPETGLQGEDGIT